MSTILRAHVAPNIRSLLSQPQSLHTVSRACASSCTVGGTPALVRRYTIPAGSTGPDSAPQKKASVTRPRAPRMPKVPSSGRVAVAPQLGQARHEVHEGSAAISMPFNPPGGGPNAPGGGGGGGFTFTNSPVLDAILTTAIGIGAVFVGGIVYVKWYKVNVLNKIEAAFDAGYDPALELARPHTVKTVSPAEADEAVDPLFTEDGVWSDLMRRKEQDLIDQIIHGKEGGHYFMLLGPKGSGKGTMIFDAMFACKAEGVSMCDAHPDLEVFRLRLGKALNFEYNEDTQTGLFQRRDPREGGPALDVERALNKLEKVAIRCAARRGKPLVLVINNIHYFQNNDEGRNMLVQLQQRAEAWAASGILTVVFSSDDVWPFHALKKTGSRMQVLSIYDLEPEQAVAAATNLRKGIGLSMPPTEELREAVSLVGGRLSFVNKVSKSINMLAAAKHLLEVEKAWIQSQIGLIPDCDDDVMDEQKWSSCSWLLLREFVKARKEQEEALIAEGKPIDNIPLPSIPYWKCRQIMTRTDFMEELDRLNIIAIDKKLHVRPDSNLTLFAAREVTEEEGFDELLDGVRDRIDEIESLHRTRELTFKDLNKGDMVRLSVDKRGEEISRTLDGDDD